jgi:hypothetical protein
MLYALDELVRRAQQVYTDGAPLREKDHQRELVAASEHLIDIPEHLVEYAWPFYTHIGEDKLNRGVSLLHDPLGARVKVAPPGPSQKALQQATAYRDWCEGMLKVADVAGQGSQDSLIRRDILLFGRACRRILPNPSVWAGILKSRKSKLLQPGFLTQAHTIDDVRQLAEDVLAESYGVSRDEEAQARQPFLRVPIDVARVPPASIRIEKDAWGPCRAWEYQRWSVQNVLDTFVDHNGDPLARDLALAVEGRELTESDVCTLCIRADRTHVQYAILSLSLDDQVGDDAYRRPYGHDEIIWEGEHGLGALPYAWYEGRVTHFTDDARRYSGYLDPILDAVRALDTLITQLLTAAFFAAYPQLAIERPENATADPLRKLGKDGEGPTFTIEPGGISVALGPGEKFVRVPWTSPEDYDHLHRSIDHILRFIDMHTLGPTAYGSHAGADSGFQYGQMQAATENTLTEYEIGLEKGDADACDKMRRTALALMRRGLGGIPVRLTTEEGQRYVTLEPEVAEIEFDTTVEIRTQPAGGLMALAQTMGYLKSQGWISDLTAQERLNIRNPEREAQRRLVEAITNQPAMLDLAAKVVQQRVLQALTQQLAPVLPGQPMLSSNLAGLLGQSQAPDLAGLQARLPGGLDALTGGMPPADLGGNVPGGGPATFGQQLQGQGVAPDALRAPTGYDTRGGPGPLGPPYGQGQAMPGGLARQDLLNSLRR